MECQPNQGHLGHFMTVVDSAGNLIQHHQSEPDLKKDKSMSSGASYMGNLQAKCLLSFN